MNRRTKAMTHHERTSNIRTVKQQKVNFMRHNLPTITYQHKSGRPVLEEPHTTALSPRAAQVLVSPTSGPFGPSKRTCATTEDAHSTAARMAEGRNIIFRFSTLVKATESFTCQSNSKNEHLPNDQESCLLGRWSDHAIDSFDWIGFSVE